MTRAELTKEVFKISYLQGEFKLRSGQTSNEYFDKYRFESQPKLLAEIAKQMAPLIPAGTEILAGLEMGGIPVATALSLATGIPVVFVRKKPKDYGTCRFAEGIDIKNKKVCVIEDVITTGGQVVLSTQDLRSDGAVIGTVLCVIHRGQNPQPQLQEIGLNLECLFTMDELKKANS
jgi:orotate phosphoribosyltransferase